MSKPLQSEIVDISKLKKHPKNYREHNDDQLDHIVESLKKNGQYKNIVVAKDYTVLAGHGVLKGATKLGMKKLAVIKLNILPDSVAALKILTGDNEISRLAEIDDRELSNILKTINDSEGLMGTGYDPMMLANLVMVTRHESEIKGMNEAAEWVGMPDYQDGVDEFKVVVNFANLDDRQRFFERIGQKATEKSKSIWFPHRENSDRKSVRFD